MIVVGENMRRLGRGGWELGRRTQEEVVEKSRKGKGCRGKQQQQQQRLQRQQWKEEGGVRVKNPCVGWLMMVIMMMKRGVVVVVVVEVGTSPLSHAFTMSMGLNHVGKVVLSCFASFLPSFWTL